MPILLLKVNSLEFKFPILILWTKSILVTEYPLCLESLELFKVKNILVPQKSKFFLIILFKLILLLTQNKNLITLLDALLPPAHYFKETNSSKYKMMSGFLIIISKSLTSLDLIIISIFLSQSKTLSLINTPIILL
jgi:hypothetical protein